MIGRLYENPLRVYVALFLLALWGVFAGFSLPVSLFPNSSKPVVSVHVPYGPMTAKEFHESFGKDLESALSGVLVDGHRVEKITADYGRSNVDIRIEFEWNTSGEKAVQDARSLVSAFSASWPEESRVGHSVNYWRENGGFLALSYYSEVRSMDQLYDELKPLMSPIASQVPDASQVGLYNPNNKRVQVILSPEKMAKLQVLPSDLEAAFAKARVSYSGGQISVGEKQMQVELPTNLRDLTDIESLPVYTVSGNRLSLRDVAEVQLKVDAESSEVFKTSGVPSLILFAEPKPAGNVKKMADDILNAVEEINKNLPSDVHYKVLVNPSEFINSSINSVVKEVGLAALIAVVILMLFIGSLKNVITAAVEIPLSIVMAFILMKIFNINLNLISLGGLALSAGMNVDASVVVMENIFRHFEKADPKMNYRERLAVVQAAVAEVALPVIASTISSLVVFLPLILTSGLTNSILGDLAKAVVFSHGMSAIVALVLVPTVRLQMMKSETSFHLVSPIEKQFAWLERAYGRTLEIFLNSAKIRWVAYGSIMAVIIVAGTVILPKLPVEVIGRPETDWVILGYNSPAFTDRRQIESFTEKLEFDLLRQYEGQLQYTFTQIRGIDNGMIMLRLKDRADMDKVWKTLEEKYVNTPTMFYWSEPWNPSELPIPNPPHMRLEIRGADEVIRAQVVKDLKTEMQETQIFPRISVDGINEGERVVMDARLDILQSAGTIGPGDVANYLRVITKGKKIGEVSFLGKTYSVDLKGPENRFHSIEDLRGLPVAMQSKIVPLSAVAQLRTEKDSPAIYRLNQTDMSVLTGRLNESDKSQAKEKQAEMKPIVEAFAAKAIKKAVNVMWTAPDQEILDALSELKWAVLLSIFLIFAVIVIQFGDVVSALLVLVAVPLGFIGVIFSLFIFKSTLSLNSGLGMILLNGIAVANSIILVDFMKKKIADGLSPKAAAIEASKARLRPILMTSLTTVLGMTPIALGFGEGGRILRPLGISVAGGLWISMMLTLIVVPTLQVSYMESKLRRKAKSRPNVNWQAPEATL